jgi:hypothetical protein
MRHAAATAAAEATATIARLVRDDRISLQGVVVD